MPTLDELKDIRDVYVDEDHYLYDRATGKRVSASGKVKTKIWSYQKQSGTVKMWLGKCRGKHLHVFREKKDGTITKV